MAVFPSNSSNKASVSPSVVTGGRGETGVTSAQILDTEIIVRRARRTEGRGPRDERISSVESGGGRPEASAAILARVIGVIGVGGPSFDHFRGGAGEEELEAGGEGGGRGGSASVSGPIAKAHHCDEQGDCE